MPDESTSSLLRRHAAKIVTSYLKQHTVSTEELPNLIRSVHRALSTLGEPEEPEKERTPAVPVRRSVRHDYLICLDCGFRGTSLRRHLSTRHGLMPEEYRTRWNLPHDHPIVAPAYSERRAELAKAAGLGVRATAAAPEPA
jgi:predicted transcriptional regulator